MHAGPSAHLFPNGTALRRNAGETVFRINKGVKALTFSSRVNVVVTAGLDRVIRVSVVVSCWRLEEWTSSQLARGALARAACVFGIACPCTPYNGAFHQLWNPYVSLRPSGSLEGHNSMFLVRANSIPKPGVLHRH